MRIIAAYVGYSHETRTLIEAFAVHDQATIRGYCVIVAYNGKVGSTVSHGSSHVHDNLLAMKANEYITTIDQASIEKLNDTQWQVCVYNSRTIDPCERKTFETFNSAVEWTRKRLPESSPVPEGWDSVTA
jgi:hypothetical protein